LLAAFLIPGAVAFNDDRGEKVLAAQHLFTTIKNAARGKPAGRCWRDESG
jgi:hypothetical protein